MIVVNSYYRRGSDEYTPVEEVQRLDTDLDLMEGAIELTVNGRSLLDRTLWDYAYVLWAHLADAVGDLRTTGEGSLTFPDQPVAMTLSTTPKGVTVCVHSSSRDRVAVVGEAEFIEAIRARGAAFFQWAMALFPGDRQVIQASLARLFEEPGCPGGREAPWETRLDSREVAAVREAERTLGRQLSPTERERLVRDVAGRGLPFSGVLTKAVALANGNG